MKKNRILSVFSAMTLLMAGACSDDTLDQGKGGLELLNPDSSGGVYMTVDFQMPSADGGTRSETTPEGGSTGGTEIGSETENNVSTALIVLASTEAKTMTVASEDGNGQKKVEVQKYGYIVAGEVQTNHIAYLDTQDKIFRASAKLNKANLNTLYGMYATSTPNPDNEEESVVTYNVPEVYVFVFCNPTKELSEMFSDGNAKSVKFGSADWINQTCHVIQGKGASNENIGIWSANSFLMNNKSLTTRELPKKLLDWEYYNSYDRSFHLSEMNDQNPGAEVVDNGTTNRGAVEVERSIARFDFRDGSSKGKNSYDVLYSLNATTGNPEEGKPVVGVQIQKMCLVNMSNEFYYLPRVSNDGLPLQVNDDDVPDATINNYLLLGRERRWTRNPVTGEYTDGNYVVGPNAYNYKNGIGNDFSKYFNYPFFEDNGSFNNELMAATRWDVVKVEDVLSEKNPSDNYKNDTPDPNNPDLKFNNSFKVWRYVVENVIPAPIDNQVNGISTGVVFKGKLQGTYDADLTYYEENWDKGHYANLNNCLNGKTFTYNDEEDHILQGNSKEDPILYYFSGHLYMGWRHIRQAAIQASCTLNAKGEIEINRSNSLYKAVFGNGPIPTTYTANTPMVYIAPDNSRIDIKDELWEEYKDKPESDIYKAYVASPNYAWSVWAANDKEVGDDATGASAPATLIAMRKAVTGAGITIYQSSKDEDYGAGYYCYYYYWNRHNDNGLNGSMGPMEFDVVRNNVYKLYIDKIARLGHPRIPENDPNNPDPKTPDESDDIYLDVKLQIVPWAVRLNGIVF